MLITLSSNDLSYRPWFPSPKIVRHRGIVNSATLIIMWFKMVLMINLKKGGNV